MSDAAASIPCTATSPSRSAPRPVRIGTAELAYPSPALAELPDATPLLGDPAALRRRLEEDGCLLLRGLHDRELVLAARRQMLTRMAAAGALAADAPLMDGVVAPGFARGLSSKELTACPAYRELVASPRIMGFFDALFGAPSMTYDFKWLRAVRHGDFTGAHMDIVYMGRGTTDVCTCWTPIGDVAIEQGPLAVCLGSHRAPGFARVRETYGRMDVDRDHVQGHFSTDPREIAERFGGRWATTAFRAGDALVFGMFTMHMSLVNVSDRWRLTTDTRYQRAADPVDERWVGAQPKGHYAWNTPGANVDMTEARRQWGV